MEEPCEICGNEIPPGGYCPCISGVHDALSNVPANKTAGNHAGWPGGFVSSQIGPYNIISRGSADPGSSEVHEPEAFDQPKKSFGHKLKEKVLRAYGKPQDKNLL